MLRQVGFEDPGPISRAYPHQLSGGQLQRAALAQALACGPTLLIADEPTAALDPSSRAEIVALLADLRARLGIAMLLISHDPALLAELADRLLVVYAGEVAEIGGRDEVIREPLHPYTRELLRCAPRHPAAPAGRRLAVIPGPPPDLARPPPACRFAPRCPDRMEICGARRPGLLAVSAGRRARCLKHAD